MLSPRAYSYSSSSQSGTIPAVSSSCWTVLVASSTTIWAGVCVPGDGAYSAAQAAPSRSSGEPTLEFIRYIVQGIYPPSYALPSRLIPTPIWAVFKFEILAKNCLKLMYSKCFKILKILSSKILQDSHRKKTHRISWADCSLRLQRQRRLISLPNLILTMFCNTTIISIEETILCICERSYVIRRYEAAVFFNILLWRVNQ